MAKFQQNYNRNSATQAAQEPVVQPPTKPAHPSNVVMVTPPPAPVPEHEAALIQVANKAIAHDVADILSETESDQNRDKPNTKHGDTDFANHDMLMGGKRMIQTDALARALNAECYLLDVPKPWGINPLGGRPVAVNFTREFPGKNVLYDHFDAAPETNTREKIDKLVAFKMKMANDHGFVYLYQHPWTILTTTELDRQLAAQRELLKGLQKK